MKFKNKIKQYFSSFSTQLSLFSGLLFYSCYALAHAQAKNPYLIGVSVFVAFFLPFFSRLSNKIEEKLQFHTAMITIGRLGRFAFQFLFNLGIFYMYALGKVIPQENIDSIGGIWGITFLTTLASQGLQYFAISISNREMGNKNLNVIVSLSVNITLTALATLGVIWPKLLLTGVSYLSGGTLFLLGVSSDLRSYFYPKKGVGFFFGTFNPFHKTHLELIKEVIAERNLEKVYIQCTAVPKLHRDALIKGEIAISHYESGMRIYKKTDKADVHANYFPTGNKFYEYKTRRAFIELVVEEEGLQEQVVVLNMEEEYQKSGFYGVINAIKKLHPGTALHGIHGSDLGGMWVRSIYDESGWIYPKAVKRRGKVSATAIRNGEKGMTSPIITEILENLRQNKPIMKVKNLIIDFDNGVLNYETAR